MVNEINEQDEIRSALEVMAAITGTPLHMKEFQADWILLTYDLPTNKDGNRARADFLARASQLGAVQHSESVYMVPWTDDFNTVALDLAQVEGGKVYLWYANVQDATQAVELTQQYDVGLARQVDKLEERALRILTHATGGKQGIARKMLPRAWQTFQALGKACTARGSEGQASRLMGVRDALRLAQAVVDGDLATVTAIAGAV